MSQEERACWCLDIDAEECGKMTKRADGLCWFCAALVRNPYHRHG